jgi:hypothetical protein
MALGNKTSIKADSFRPIKDNVFVSDLESGPTITAGGIIRPDDNMSATGIRPRWGRVWAIGPDIKDIVVGEWVYIEHARWTNAIDMELADGKIRVWKVEWPESVLLVTPEDPREQRLSTLPRAQHPTSSKNHVRSIAPSIIRKREY